MTTIAFDGDTMASDGLATDQWGLLDPDVPKISEMRIDGGATHLLIGAAGTYGTALLTAQRLKAYLADGKSLLEFDFKDMDPENDISMMAVGKRKGEPPAIFVRTGRAFRQVKTRPFYAIGSGRDFALTAMFLGLRAAEAVRAASEFDINTNKVLHIHAFARDVQ